MSLKTRRILYIVFILAFLLITPLLIFYSLGYNFQSGFKLQKSGILVIETEPKGAKINIEGENVQKFWGKILNKDKYFVRTPAKIKNLNPGDYNIQVKLKGYWPWTKKLTIYSGQTTFAEDIYLFKNDKPILIKKIPKGISDFSPNKKYFININQKQATLINLDNQNLETFVFDNSTSTSDLTKTISWSNNEKKIMTNLDIFFLDDWSSPIHVKSILGEEFSNFKWGDFDNDTVLYIYDKKLFSFNLSTKNNREILDAKNIISFLPKNDNIYLIKQTDNKSQLQIWNQTSKINRLWLELPFSNYNFININHGLINLFDYNYNILYLIDPDSNLKPLKQILYNCKKMQWVTNTKLLYTTGYEIWLFDLNSLEKKLLTRISEQINNIEWHPSNNYIIFSTKKNINILELDNREKHSITKIAEFNNIEQMSLDKKGETVFFTTNDKGERKLYKIFIQ